MSRGHIWFIPDSGVRIPIHRDGSAREDARSAWLRSTRLCEDWQDVETERWAPAPWYCKECAVNSGMCGRGGRNENTHKSRRCEIDTLLDQFDRAAASGNLVNPRHQPCRDAGAWKLERVHTAAVVPSRKCIWVEEGGFSESQAATQADRRWLSAQRRTGRESDGRRRGKAPLPKIWPHLARLPDPSRWCGGKELTGSCGGSRSHTRAADTSSHWGPHWRAWRLDARRPRHFVHGGAEMPALYWARTLSNNLQKHGARTKLTGDGLFVNRPVACG